MFAQPLATGVSDNQTQGMIAPQNAFVNAGGQLNPVSFAFLYNTFNTANKLLEQMVQAQADIAAATGGITNLQNDIASINGTLGSLQGQINTINGEIGTINGQIASILQRMANFGIP
jgi:peptidoglycan hydrolase CwlO-like protein